MRNNGIEEILKYKHPSQKPIPFFRSISGSTEGPGVFGEDWYGHPISLYEVYTVPKSEMLIVEYVSAGVMRGSEPYPAENINDVGEIGFTTVDGDRFEHTIYFVRNEPGGILHASQAIRLYVPSKASLFVSVPLIGQQSGGAKVDVSGFKLKT
jgi:hypothetical protein